MPYPKNALLIGIILTLTACGISPADKVLNSIHEAVVLKISTSLIDGQIKGPSQTSMSTQITIESENSAPIKGSADISFEGDLRNDNSKKRPFADANAHLSLRIEMPAVAPSNSNVAKENINADITVALKTIDGLLLAAVQSLDATGTIFPVPLKMPEKLKMQWYGISFKEIDDIIKTRAKMNVATVPPPIEDVLGQFFAYRNHRKSFVKLVSNLHMWKGIEVLPEESDQLHIRVESDKKKIQSSVRALMSYMREMSGSSSDFEKQIQRLRNDDTEFMNSIGIIKGIISVDKESLEWMGFKGDVIDTAGIAKGSITFSRTKNGDAKLIIAELESSSTMQFEKIGNHVTGTLNGQGVLSGTVSSKSVALTAKDPDTNTPLFNLQFELGSLTVSEVDINNFVLAIPSEKTSIHIKNLTMKTSNTGTTLSLDASGNTEKLRSFALTLHSEKKPIQSFVIEKPNFKPLQNLYQDFLQMLIAATTPSP